MLLLRLLLAVVVFTYTNAEDCLCYEPSQVYDPVTQPFIYIVSPYTLSGKNCIRNCTIHAYSNTQTDGFTNFTIGIWSVPTGVQASIDVLNSDGTYLIKGVTGKSNDTDPRHYLLSSTPNITIQMTIVGTGSVSIYGQMVRGTGLDIPTKPPTTQPPPTTAPYAGSFNANPALISNDLMILLDNGFGQNPSMFPVLAQTVSNLVTNLSLTGDINSVTQTRIGFSPLNQYNQFSPRGQTWGLSQTTMQTILSSLTSIGPVPGPSNYTGALTTILTNGSSPFSILPTAGAPSRPYAQRTLIIFTSKKPADFAGISALSAKFTALDVHPIIAGYQLSDDDKAAFKGLTGWGFSDLQTTSVLDLMNNFLLNGDSLCLPGSQSFIMGATIAPPPYNVQQPNQNYKGPNGTQVNPTWTPNDGQNGRYCNFQNTQYTFQQKDASTPICFTVQYELEVEKDYLRFYSGSSAIPANEVVSLTGTDVTGSTFSINNNVTVTFQTDSRQVFGGFYLQAKNCPTTST